MNETDMCFVCRHVDSRANLGAWLDGDALRAVHLECWLAAYDSRRPHPESGDVDSRRPWQHGSEQAS
jgi:hypothetical protein